MTKKIYFESGRLDFKSQELVPTEKRPDPQYVFLIIRCRQYVFGVHFLMTIFVKK